MTAVVGEVERVRLVRGWILHNLRVGEFSRAIHFEFRGFLKRRVRLRGHGLALVGAPPDKHSSAR